MSNQDATTRDRILRAFLRLVAERGIEATTTRAIAEEAGVNEVTIFRHFGDKATLAREVYHRFAGAERITALPLDIDTSSPERVVHGLLTCLRRLRGMLLEHPELLQFGLGEAWRFPDLVRDIAAAPLAAYDYLQRALTVAAPALRPEVEPAASALSLQGVMLLSVIWQDRGWLAHSNEEWERIFEANIRPLVRGISPAASGDTDGRNAREA